MRRKVLFEMFGMHAVRTVAIGNKRNPKKNIYINIIDLYKYK